MMEVRTSESNVTPTTSEGDAAARFQDQLNQEEANVSLKDFASIFVDEEVDAKYKRVEEAQALAADPSTYLPEIEETEVDRKAAAKELLEAEKLRKKKEVLLRKTKKKKSRKKGPFPWKKLAKIKVELRELRVKSIDHQATWIPVLHPCTALVVRKKLGVELRRDWKGIRLVYMGGLLKKDMVIPDECYHARRFNFLRWVDDAAVREYERRLKEAEEKRKGEEEERMLQLLKERQLQQQKLKKAQEEEDRPLLVDDGDIFSLYSNYNDEGESPSPSPPATPTSPALSNKPGFMAPAIQIVIQPPGAAEASPKGGRRSPMKTRRHNLLAFDLRHELEHIHCEQFADALIARGFGDKGAFAYITEEEVTGPGLWINPRAARRVMALADFYKRHMELENQSKTTQLAAISEGQSQDKKYTLDGVIFYNTQMELNAAVEAERNRKMSVYVRPMSVKKEASAEVKELHETIDKRMKLEEEKAEGVWSTAEHVESHFCCKKHRGVFDAHIEGIVKREGVDYDNDFNLMLMEAHKNNQSEKYLPEDAYRSVIAKLFTKHGLPFRLAHIDKIMRAASLDDNGLHYNQEALIKASVKLLEDRKRHLLLDLQGV